jgi:hypothetical protein
VGTVFRKGIKVWRISRRYCVHRAKKPTVKSSYLGNGSVNKGPQVCLSKVRAVQQNYKLWSRTQSPDHRPSRIQKHPLCWRRTASHSPFVQPRPRFYLFLKHQSLTTDRAIDATYRRFLLQLCRHRPSRCSHPPAPNKYHIIADNLLCLHAPASTITADAVRTPCPDPTANSINF